MKRIITICAAFLMTASVFAQAPEKMSYQAVVRDGSNNLVSSTAVGMQISILQGSASGTAVYVETQAPTSNANGLVSLEIGSGTVVSGDFSTIDWANGPYFIQTETDPTGGTSYTISGTSQLMSMPYALHAKTAESVVGGGTGTETDPVFGASPASGIAGTDITNWNNKQEQLTAGTGINIAGTTINATGISTETDPVFDASVASDITATDTTYWNNKLDSSSIVWQKNNNDIYFDSGYVGIGTNNPSSRLHLIDTLPADHFSIGTELDFVSGNATDSVYSGLRSAINGTSGINRAIHGSSFGANSQENQAIIGFASNAVTNRSIIGVSNQPNLNSTNGFNYGAIGIVGQSEFSNIAIGGYAQNANTPSGTNYGIVGSATSTTPDNNYGIFAEASNAGTNNYAGFFNGDVTITGTLTNPSDVRLKFNIKKMDNALTIIRQLNPVEYDYKKEYLGKRLNLPKGHQFGFVAQEIESVLPELVSSQKINFKTIGSGKIDGTDSTSNDQEIESEEFIGVNYISIIPILVEGMKEQDEKINELENLVLELKKEVDALKKQ